MPPTCARCLRTWAVPPAIRSGSICSAGDSKWFDISRTIELFINKEKKLNANVDFYSASTYTTLGVEIDLFTPIFAISRIAGWAAHVIEQLDDNRLIRPRADYIGPPYPEPYTPIAER